MQPEQIAANIFINTKEKKNFGLIMIETIRLLENQNLDEVLNIYKDIVNKKRDVVLVKTGIELSEAQKQKIKSKVEKKFQDRKLIFLFDVTSSNEVGLQIEINDNIIDLSINNLISGS